MSDSKGLVERLRLNADKSPGYFGILGEAADCIEELEREVERLRRHATLALNTASSRVDACRLDRVCAYLRAALGAS